MSLLKNSLGQCALCGMNNSNRLTQRDTAPVFLHQPWREFERDLRRARRTELLRYIAVGLFLVGVGILLGRLI